MPTMSDKRFRRSVIYLCTHSREGAMGLIVNQRAPDLTFVELMKQLGVLEGSDDESIADRMIDLGVHVGGPVARERGFVLHSNDYFVNDSTLAIDDDFALTATIDILKAMATGEGPSKAILALGYAGWAPGQLETEIQANGWLHCEADTELVFGNDVELKYERALSKLGIDPSHLVSEAGHA